MSNATVVQEWCLCPYEWGLDNMIAIRSTQGILVLCDVEYEYNQISIGINPKVSKKIKKIQPIPADNLNSL